MTIMKVRCKQRFPWNGRVYEAGSQLEMTEENANLFQAQVTIVGPSAVADLARGNLHPDERSQRLALRTR